MYIESFFINKISTYKYQRSLSSYGMTEKAIKYILVKYKKDITIEDIYEILKHKVSLFRDQTQLKFILDCVKEFKLSITINDDILTELNLIRNNYGSHYFVDFINSIGDEDDILSGGDMNIANLESIMNCRSYKIYKLNKI